MKFVAEKTTKERRGACGGVALPAPLTGSEPALSAVEGAGFTGQRKDSGSGLLFYNARWYDPTVGRFISADTIVPQPGIPQSLNRYSYTANNPLRFVDPSGHRECEEASNCNGPDPALPAAPPAYGGPCLSVVCLPTPTPAPGMTIPGTPKYQGPSYRPAPVYAPDDGWLLKYNVGGRFDPRFEYVHYSSYATRGTIPISVAGEYRSVVVFGAHGSRSFDEVAMSVAAGEVFNIGTEWTPSGGVQPSLGASLAGVEIQLQADQIMAGIVNPAGIGGGRIGAEYAIPMTVMRATSQAYLVSRGGAESLGHRLLSENATLEWEMWIPGGYANGVWVSGAQRAAAWANWAPVRVVS